jgi:thiosulfate/3-mercaptopyruvate sulfurtransferase
MPDTGSRQHPPLVSTERLAEHLEDPGLLVLDIRSAESGGREGFEAGHIPGAVHSDYAADGWRVVKGSAGGLMPEPEALGNLFGRLGLTPERPVVVVSAGQAPNDFSAAARVYWTLKAAGHPHVSILDGGFAAWTASGVPVEHGPARAGAAPPYPVRVQDHLRASLADIERALAGGGRALLDGRSRAQFEGEEKSPAAARPGRLPGAVHVDHLQAFTPGSGRLRPAAELDRLYAAVPDGPVASYCNTGHLAATNWFVLSEVLNRPDVALYDGSMSEWTADPAHPVAVGPEDKRG